MKINNRNNIESVIVFLLLIFIPIGSPLVALFFIQDMVPYIVALLLASLIPMPLIALAFSVINRIDAKNQLEGRSKKSVMTWHGAIWGQAGVFIYMPIAISSKDSDLKMFLNPSTTIFMFGLAVVCVWLGFKIKKQHLYSIGISKLAESHPNLAIRFSLQRNKKAWWDIQPENVLEYQNKFERTLSTFDSDSIAHASAMSNEQIAAMWEVAKHVDYNIHSGTIVALVLVYLEASCEERVRDRAEWAAAIATRVNASEIRDRIWPLVETTHKQTQAFLENRNHLHRPIEGHAAAPPQPLRPSAPAKDYVTEAPKMAGAPLKQVTLPDSSLQAEIQVALPNCKVREMQSINAFVQEEESDDQAQKPSEASLTKPKLKGWAPGEAEAHGQAVVEALKQGLREKGISSCPAHTTPESLPLRPSATSSPHDLVSISAFVHEGEGDGRLPTDWGPPLMRPSADDQRKPQGSFSSKNLKNPFSQRRLRGVLPHGSEEETQQMAEILAAVEDIPLESAKARLRSAATRVTSLQPSKTTLSPHDLVELVMRRHGVTREEALEMLKEQGM